MLAPAPGCCVRFKVHGVEPASELMRPVDGPWRACCSLPLLHGTFLNCACPLTLSPALYHMPCSRAVQSTPESLQGMSVGLRLPSGITRVWATSDSQPAPVAVAQGGWATSDCPLPAQLAEAAGPEQEAPSPVVMHAASGAPSLLAASVYESFYKHYPLRLNPNVLWVTITQGLARVIELDPSAFQGKFCCLGSRRALTVVEPEAASPADVPWQQAVASFAAQIGSSIGQGALALLTAPFSNTTPNDTVASQICLMDAMQSYFQYDLLVGCGIPYIELQGTPADWAELRARAAALRPLCVGPLTLHGHVPSYCRALPPFSLSTWLSELLPVLDKLAEAAAGAPDASFFGAVANGTSASGELTQPLTGWVTVFYPVNKDGLPTGAWQEWRGIYEHTLAVGGADAALASASQAFAQHKWSRRKDIEGCLTTHGLKLEDIPIGLARAPLALSSAQTGQAWQLYLLAGPTTMHQSRGGGALEVRCGWAVCELQGEGGGQ